MPILHVALAQISPVWLDRIATTEKVISMVCQAAKRGCQLVAFGEGLLPGYPFWLETQHGGHNTIHWQRVALFRPERERSTAAR